MHEVEVQEVFFLVCVLASVLNNNAEIWEHASPKPAMQVQCAQMILPFRSAAIQGWRGVAVSFCECLTSARSNDTSPRLRILICYSPSLEY